MNLKKLIVYDYENLFQILEEFREILNFELIKKEKDDYKSLRENLDTNVLVIAKENKENLKNFLKLDNPPYKMLNLIQAINLKFLKNKFNFQSDVEISSYKLNLNSREISKNQISLALTERETNLILYLYQAKKAVKIDILQKDVWEYGSKLETHTVETHIYRLRKKIKEKFNDENFILSLKDGYKIN